MRALTLDEIIRRAKKIHGDRYDYSKTVCQLSTGKIEIGCPDHGSFWQTVDAHLHGKACRICSYLKRGKQRIKPEAEFIQKAREVHGTKYEYENYRSTSRKLTVTCPVHGPFNQIGSLHLAGSGCPSCKNIRTSELNRYTTEEFIQVSKEVHTGFYSYEESVYKNATTPVSIRCPRHGLFTQPATFHMAGFGCKKCGVERRVEIRARPLSDMLSLFRQRHGNTYQYNPSGYRNTHSPMQIKCETHGWFTQEARRHANGAGCPACAAHKSEPESALYAWVQGLCPDAISRDRSILGTKELDIYVPGNRTAIEFNGIYWHSCEPGSKRSFRDFEKWKTCREKGIDLFTVWQDQWERQRPVIEHWLRHKLGKAPRLCGARQTTVETPTYTESSTFYSRFHLQGPSSASCIHVGLRFNGNWVAMASFSKSAERGMRLPTGEYYFARLAFAGSLPGGASKLFSAFIKSHQPASVHAHSDNSYADGGVKQLLGFEVVGQLKPRYRLWHPRFGIKHRTFWQKSKIPARLIELHIETVFDPATQTTFDGHRLCGCRHLWDCGKTRWLWKGRQPRLLYGSGAAVV